MCEDAALITQLLECITGQSEDTRFREEVWGRHSIFKGNSSPCSCRLAALYITSVPECSPRWLVSILSPESKCGVTVWPACLPVCLFVYLPSHCHCRKQTQLSFSETQTTPAWENGSWRLNRWQTIWDNRFLGGSEASMGTNHARIGRQNIFGTFHSCLGAVCDYPAAFNTCSSHRGARPRACRITEGWGAQSYD